MEKDKKVTKSSQTILSKIKNILFSSRRRTIITVIVILVFGFFAWQAFGQGKKQTQYQTAQVQRETIIQTVSENGNVASGSQAGVGSPTTGIVEEIYVKDGDTVKAGDKLFKIKS